MSRQPYRLALRALSRPSPSLPIRNTPRSRFLLPTPTTSRYASSSVPTSQPPMPPDMPRENYAEPTLYTLSYLSRIIKLLVYSALGISAAGLVGFESLHLYIEHRLMATPSGSSAGVDEYDWESENTSWTGREKGGTDPKLGWKARHALRGAWICQEWGAGGPSGTIGRSIHPGPRSGSGTGTGVEVNRVDRGFELAEEYIDIAIKEAEKRGITFPGSGGVGKEVDQTALDLLLLKAGVLERLATEQSLIQAKGVYMDVLDNLGEKELARAIRISGKIGDLTQRTGGDGSGWWRAGLQRAGLDVPSGHVEVIQPKVEKRGWFGRSVTSEETIPRIQNQVIPTIHLPPPVLRAIISILISTEANLATSSQYAQSASVQNFALSLLPSTSSPRSSESSRLQDLWISHRTALLTLHSASVSHARKLPSEAIESATSATSLVESIIPQIPSPAIFNPISPPAKLLARDAQALAGEANYTRGLLLERSKVGKDLEVAGECFEKAMGYAGERGAEWDRYWRAFARVREKLEKQREAERGVVA